MKNKQEVFEAIITLLILIMLAFNVIVDLQTKSEMVKIKNKLIELKLLKEVE